MVFVGARACVLPQVAAENALHQLQDRRHQLGLRGQQPAQRDRRRQHPLPHRHARE
jgi:hypothetical protein